MKPSSTTGTRCAAPASMTPTRPAISKPPTLASTSSAVARIGPIHLERARDRLDLPPAARLVHAGARPGDVLDRGAGQRRHHGAGRRRVADAHLAGADQVERPPRARPRPARCPPRSPRAPRSRVIAGPRVMLRVPGAIRIDRSAGMGGERAGHAEVRDDDLGARPAGEHVDRGAAAQEVLDHLRRHDLRIGAHALRRRRRDRRRA